MELTDLGRKKNIAFLMGLLENEYSNMILDGAVKGAQDMDVNLIVFPMDLINVVYDDWEVNRYRYQYNVLDSYVSAGSLDGIIVEYGSITGALDEDEKKEFLGLFGNVPTVLLSEANEYYTNVCVRNETGLIQLMEHLILDHKYTKIGFLSGIKDSYDAQVRLGVYRDEMKKYNLPADEGWIEYGNFSPYISEQVKALIGRHPDMEVLVCANDAMALGAIDTLREMGIEPGRDIFVTGFDNVASGILCEPALTSVSASPGMLAYRAMEELLNYHPEPHTIYVDSTMARRQSCGCHDYKADKEGKQFFGIYDDWRKSAKLRVDENLTRRDLEHELGNVTRKMVFALDTEKERYESILKTVRRLGFKTCSIFLYDEVIEHKKEDKWILPEQINLVGCYRDLQSDQNYTYALGSNKFRTSELFDEGSLGDGKRHMMIVLPLFFGDRQMGLMTAETEKNQFEYAYSMAVQISNILYVTELHEQQKRMKMEIEAASESKSMFLANMSHEIRTPINAVIGFNEMILRENEDPDVNEYAHDIQNAANALLLIVNDTLDFSKIEAGKMEVVNESYNVSELMKNIVGMLNSRAEDKGLSLYFIYDNGIPERLIGDQAKIQQVLINIISNAIKYTNEGTVTLTVKGRSEGQDEYLHFSVKDTGIGIRQEDIGHLFNAYERVDVRRNHHIEGTGLGISIVAGLLKLMESELKVESVYGKGSDFSFELKQRIDTAPVREKDSPDKPGKEKTEIRKFEAPEIRIMVVDDNLLNRKVFASLLKETKIAVDKVESGSKCLEMLADNRYDIIFLDHMMPEMDGIETLQEILGRGLIDKTQTPVIALTANAIAGAKEKYISLGFTDYLSKPVLPAELYSMIIRHCNGAKIHFKGEE